MKKIGISLTLMTVLALALSGCGKTEPVQKQGTEKPKVNVTQEKKENSKEQVKVALKDGSQPKEQQSPTTSNTTQPQTPTQSEEQIKSAILKSVEENLHATQAEDINGTMETYAKSAQTDDVKGQLEELFKDFDIQYTLVNAEITNHTDKEATVKVVQRNIATKVADGYQYKNNQMTLEHHLVLEDNKWKLDNTKILDMQEVDTNGNVVKNVAKP